MLFPFSSAGDTEILRYRGKSVVKIINIHLDSIESMKENVVR